MTEVISLVTSIAACLSAIAALIVVRQNFKQRTESYRPDLVFVKTTVWLKPFEGTQGWPQVADDNDSTQISIPIVNVGLGAARDLKVSWKFPINQVVSSVNHLSQQSLAREYFEFKNGSLSMKSDMQWTIHWKVEKEAEFDYVLPASIQQTRPDQLGLPLTYIALVLGYYHFAFKSQSLDIPELPKLECRLTYVDIGGTKHRVDLLIAVEPMMISHDKVGAIVQCSLRNN